MKIVIAEQDGKGISIEVKQTEIILKLDNEAQLTGPLTIIVPNKVD